MVQSPAHNPTICSLATSKFTQPVQHPYHLARYRTMQTLTLRTTPRYFSLATRPARSSCNGLLLRRPVGSARTYALSRFEKTRPGVGRERPKIVPKTVHNPQKDDTQASQSYQYEDKPSVSQSSLWEESVRPPSSNPEEGLRKLLMENDKLVVTRYVHTYAVRREEEETDWTAQAN